MNNLKLSAAAILFILMAGYILYLTQCNRPKPCPPGQTRYASVDTQNIIRQYKSSTIPTTKIVYLPGDTIKEVIPGKPLPPKTIEVVKEIPTQVDTDMILRNYYSKRIQEDSLVRPEFTVKTTDTIQYNMITGREWNVTTTSKTIIKTPVIPRYVYFGGGGHHSATNFISDVHVDLGYINRKGQHFKIDLGLANNQLQYGASFYQTIWTIK